MKFTPKQEKALDLIAGQATHILTYGGSRSGKTFLHVRNIVYRAIKADGSRHAILRYRFAHLKSAIIYDTFPKVMESCFKDVEFKLNKSDWFVLFPNGSQIWFGGLDEGPRTDKVLGNEYATIFLNECSEISNDTRETITTRLAQKCTMTIYVEDQPVSKPLKQKMYYDCNPPTKGHWSYKLFFKKIDPESKRALLAPNKDDYVHIQMNPVDNQENLTEKYINILKSLSTRKRKRFWEGEFSDDNPYALFDEVTVDKFRILDADLPDFTRVVVGVDPSGSGDTDNQHNDEIGICVAALGTDGYGYLLEDCTIKAGPGTWGNVAASAFERHKGDCIVGESNFGGDMVRFVIQTAKEDVPYKAVHASRGKVVRAEPVGALYEKGKIRHVGNFPELEDELYCFTQNGYTGESSPNRADAAIWAFTELFPGLTESTAEEEEVVSINLRNYGRDGWMR